MADIGGIVSDISAKDVAMKMKIDYARGLKDQTAKGLEAVCALCWKFERPHPDPDSFMKEVADQISRLFAIESVAIGVKDPIDKLYKYRVVTGLDKDVAEGFKTLRYTREQLLEAGTYPGYEISSHTKLFLSEDHPYAGNEEFTYRRPGLLGMKRHTLTDSLEADYLDFFFYDSNGEILGFIETSGTRMKKLPDTTMIRWIELLAALTGMVIQKKQMG